MTLASDIQDDLGDIFFNSGNNEFAVDATYTPDGGPAVTIAGIYDAQTIQGQGNVEVGERSSQPTFDCRTVDVPNASRDDTLVVSGQSHKVVGVDSDGTGVTTLILEKQ